MMQLIGAGLLLFQAVTEPQNSQKHAKYRAIQKKSYQIHVCTYLSYWGYLLAVNLQTYLKTSSLKRANNVPTLPGKIMLRKSGH